MGEHFTVTIRGTFLALPPRVFGSRLRTRDDLARFVSASHAIAATDRLDIADAVECLATLCEGLGLNDALGRQPLTIPGTTTARFLPAGRLPALAERFDAVPPGELARALDALGTHPVAGRSPWAADKGGLARQFLQLKRFCRNGATHGYDVLFVVRSDDTAPA